MAPVRRASVHHFVEQGIMTIVRTIAAVVGGMVCAAIATRGSRAPIVLALLVFVLGVAMAGAAAVAPADPDRPTERSEDLPMFEAIRYAEAPPLATWLNPLVGAVGILLGARMVRRKAT